MTLEEFIKESHESVEKFKEFYELAMQDSPEHFPVEMDFGEWDEQMRCWE